MGSRHCCVPLCTNDERKRRTPPLSFHTFPKDTSLRKQWIVAIKRDEGPLFKINDWTAVCSEHFKTTEIKKTLAGRKKLAPGAVPSLFNWKIAATRKSPKKRLQYEEPCVEGDVTATDTQATATKCPPPSNDHDYNIEQLTNDDKLAAALARISVLEQQVESLSKQRFCLHRFSSDPCYLRFYTGFSSYKLLTAFFQCIMPTAETMTRWSQVQRQRGTSCQKMNSFRFENISLIDQLFLFLCKLKQGSFEEDLADRFNVSVSTVSRIILTWTNYLYIILGSMPIWPSRTLIDQTMPSCFQAQYPKTRVILDCTEIKTEAPSSLYTNTQMFSHYKSTTTLKCLLGISPAGGISFVSALYTGSISDKEITKRSGLLDLIEPGDSVMVDKGFPIQDLLDQYGASLVIPPFLTSHRAHLSKEEAEEKQRIASLRIHVERAIRRVREYHIFDSVVRMSLVGSVNQLWTVCCLLTNFRGPLFHDKKTN